jgi:hypothetical protein
VLVWRPGYKFGSRTIIQRELKSLHTWHHISWFLFGLSLCEVLELLVIFTVIPSSLKTEFVWKTYCVFGIEGFTDLCLKRGQTFIHLIVSSFILL